MRVLNNQEKKVIAAGFCDHVNPDHIPPFFIAGLFLGLGCAIKYNNSVLIPLGGFFVTYAIAPFMLC